MDKANISVSPEIADLYNNLTPEEQLRAQAFMLIWIETSIHESGPTLGEIMDTISDRAAERGLTPELLEELLADES